MERPIIAFGADDVGDPFALLSCGHRQHVRHQPPLQSRSWVVNAATRDAMRGTALNCLRCERLELPPGFVPYKRTPEFTEATVPAGLRRDHSTKAGVWARIEVLAGRLRYRCPSLGLDVELSARTPGTVVPEILHSVEPVGAVRFLVEFYHAAGAGN